MRRITSAILSVVIVLIFVAAKSPRGLKGVDQFAQASLIGKSGTEATGTIEFGKSKKGLVVYVRADKLSPGKHGFHIHEMGDCSSDDGSSAGDHFNPTGKAHGKASGSNRHVGDLGNLVADKDGKVDSELIFAPPAKDFDWQTIVGKSVIIHEKADDLKSQPAGDSGKRIACGTITAFHQAVDIPNTAPISTP